MPTIHERHRQTDGQPTIAILRFALSASRGKNLVAYFWSTLYTDRSFTIVAVVESYLQVLDIALLHDEHMLRSALQSRKWPLIGMS